MKDEDIKLPKMISLVNSVSWNNDIEEYARQAVRMNLPASKPSEPEPFDLARAMAGEPIVTRDGRKAVFVAHDKGANPQYRVLARIGNGSGAIGFCEDGRLSHAETNTTDLLMAPKPKRTVWVNVWKNRHGYLLSSAHATTDQAAYSAQKEKDLGYLTTVHPIEIDATE